MVPSRPAARRPPAALPLLPRQNVWRIPLPRLSGPWMMAELIEIPLNRYHFRRIAWQEETRLPFTKSEDQRKTILAAALVDVSGLPVTPEQPMRILKQLPNAIFWRIWLVYRENLLQNGISPFGSARRHYIHQGLYGAGQQGPRRPVSFRSCSGRSAWSGGVVALLLRIWGPRSGSN